MSALPTSPPPAALDPNTLAQLMAVLNRGAAPGGGMAAPLPMGFAAQPQGMPAPTSVLIPVKIPMGQGSVKIHLAFGPEFADPAAMMNLLNILANAGIPIDVYVPKQPQGYGNGGGYGGGYRGNGGGGGYGGNGGGGNAYGGGGGFGGNRYGR